MLTSVSAVRVFRHHHSTPSKNNPVCIRNITPSKRPTTHRPQKNTRNLRDRHHCRPATRGYHGDGGARFTCTYGACTAVRVAPRRNRHVADTRAAAAVSAGAV